MIRPVCRMGNPVLRREADRINQDFFQTLEFKQLLQDLYDSMKHYGGIGIAAPQIGISKQVAIIELGETNRYGEKISLPLTVFVNPEIQVLDEQRQGFWEGCLSVPGLRGFVNRPRKIKLRYFDEKAKEQELIAEGFLATVIQHELDHLFGKLYVDRLDDLSSLIFQEEYEQFIEKNNEE